MKKRTSWIITITHILTAMFNTCIYMCLYSYPSGEVSKFRTIMYESPYHNLILNAICSITFLVTGVVTVKLLKIQKNKYHIFKKFTVFAVSYIVSYQLIWVFVGLE